VPLEASLTHPDRISIPHGPYQARCRALIRGRYKGDWVSLPHLSRRLRTLVRFSGVRGMKEDLYQRTW